MATIGLSVNRPATLNLSGIFKAAMPDPDLVIKGALARSQIQAQEYQNRLYEAQREQQRQLGIKTAQEAADLKARADALGIAGPAAGDLFAGAVPEVPMPVPVTFDAVKTGPFAGAAPGIVEPVNYDARVRQRLIDQENWRKIAPAIVQSSTTATDLSGGLGKGLGAVGLSAPSTPEAARRSALLYTGNLPSKDTVINAGDTAGVDAAAWQKIQEDTAAAALHPFGTDAAGSAREVAARLRAKKIQQGGRLNPLEEQQLVQADAETLVKLNKGERALQPTTDGLVDAAGAGVDPVTGLPFADQTSVPGVWQHVIDQVVELYATGQPIPDRLVREYPRAIFELQGPKVTTALDGRGRPQPVTTPANIDPSLPTPAQVIARAAGGTPVLTGTGGVTAPTGLAGGGGVGGDAGARLSGLPPTAALAVPPIAAPAAAADIPYPQIGEPGYPDPVWDKPATETEGKARELLPQMLSGDQVLGKMTQADLPSKEEMLVLGPEPENLAMPLRYARMVARDYLSEKALKYEDAVTAFAQATIYRQSGAAFGAKEFANTAAIFGPQLRDTPERMAIKQQRRTNLTNAVGANAYPNDPEALAKAAAAARIPEEIAPEGPAGPEGSLPVPKGVDPTLWYKRSRTDQQNFYDLEGK